MNNRFELPWEKEPIASLIQAFECTVQYVEVSDEEPTLTVEEEEDTK